MLVRSLVLAALVLSQLLPCPVLALVPLGPDFQVNTYTTNNQWFPAVAVDADGNFVVVWGSDGSFGSDSSDESVQAQRYDAAGIPQGGQFQVNTFTNSFQDFPAVAAQGSLMPPNAGGFVVVWWGSGAGTDNSASIQGQRYSSAGIPQGSQFQVNTYTTGSQSLPHVAADAAGNFVVVWASKVSIPFSVNPPGSIQGQRYDAAGVPQGAEFQVNSLTSANVDQISAAVATDAAGNFVVVWRSEFPYSSDHIRARRFDAGGTPQGPDFQVDNVTSGSTEDPAVAIDAAGNFVVVWPSTFDYGYGSDVDGSSIQARRYDASGIPQGSQFQVNSYTTGDQGRPRVAASVAGDFVVVWESTGSAGSDTNGPSIQGQRYDAAGAPFGIEFQVNSHTAGGQQFPAIAAGTGVVATWLSSSSAASDTSGGSVQARRFLLPDTTTTSSTSSTSTSSTSTTTLPTVELLPGRVATIRPGTLAKFVAKPMTGEAFPLPTAASVAAGGSLRIFDTAATAGDQTFTLPAIGWISLGPGGSNGYKYKGAGSVGDPCKVVLVRERVVKGVCRGTGMMLAPPFTGDVGIVLSIGTSSVYTYCARFGGSTGKNDGSATTRRNAPAPGACP